MKTARHPRGPSARARFRLLLPSALLLAALAPACSGGGGGSSSGSGGQGSGGSGSGGSSSGGSGNGSGGSGSGGVVGTGGHVASSGGSSASGGSTSSGGSSASGGSSSGGSSMNGSGGATSSGGTTGSASGGNSASGGSTGSGGSTTTSSGGAGGGATGSGGAAGHSGGTAGSNGSGTCAGMALCDDFESGSSLNSSLWTLVPSSGSGTATIDSSGAHGSGHALKVTSPDRLYLRNSSVIGTLGDTVYVRFYVKFMSALATGHGAMIVTHPMMVDQYSQSNELRFGSQDGVFHWNTDSDAANIPDVSPNGDMASFKPTANTWYCLVLTINTGGNLSASVDGADQAGLKADGMPTANIDQSWISSGSSSLSRYTKLADFNFGWQSYGAGAMTLWFDDVAVSSTPLGCVAQ